MTDLQSNMDDFIRRQYTYRRVNPNPLLKVERVWKELLPDPSMDRQNDSEGSELGDVEEVEQQTVIDFAILSIDRRLDILYNLCEWQLQSDKFRERIGVTTELQMSQWRIEAIGSDSQERVYFFLDDGRLYRCTNPTLSIDYLYQQSKRSSKKRKRSAEELRETHAGTLRDDWQCIAATYADWLAIVDELADPATIHEKRLLQHLVNEVLPVVQAIEEQRIAKAAAAKAKAERLETERLKELLRQEALASRKRSSRIASLDEKREAERQRLEQQRLEQELEERARRQADLEAKDQTINIRKTREARARDRELKEFVVERSTHASMEIREDANDVQTSPADVTWSNSIAIKNAPDTGRDFRQSLVKGNFDETSASNTVEAAPTQHGNSDAASDQIEVGSLRASDRSSTNSANTAAPDQMRVSHADLDWVNRRANYTNGDAPLDRIRAKTGPHGIWSSSSSNREAQSNIADLTETPRVD